MESHILKRHHHPVKLALKSEPPQVNVNEPKKSQEIIQPDTIILKGLEMYRFIFSFSEIFLSMHLKKNYEPNKNVCPFFAVSGFLCVMEDTT